MGAIVSQITSLTIVYSTVYSDADQRKHQSSASLAFGRGIHRGPVSFPAQMTSNAENVTQTNLGAKRHITKIIFHMLRFKHLHTSS